MRLSIHCTFPGDDARARVRAALRMLGAKDTRIEAVDEPAVTAKPAKKRLPESSEAKALHSLFGRKLNTEWTEKEVKAFIAAKKTQQMTLENISLITAYYAGERAKGEKGVHRRDLVALLNNWPGELDRAQPRSAMKHIGQNELVEPPGFREWLKAKQPDCRFGWDSLPPYLESLQRDFKNEHPELGWDGMLYVGRSA